LARKFTENASSHADFYQLDRSARLLHALIEEGMLPHVAQGILRRALEAGVNTQEGVLALDTFEIALDTCRKKKVSSQAVNNPAGLIVKLIRDQEGDRKLLPTETIEQCRNAFRRREKAALAQLELEEQRAVIIEYERFREETAQAIYDDLPEPTRASLRREKNEWLKQQPRFEKIDARARDNEVEQLICQDIARREVPPFEKWYLRRRASQALLQFDPATTALQ
jgi:hypothetical protein